jgi:hypothetical protein
LFIKWSVRNLIEGGPEDTSKIVGFEVYGFSSFEAEGIKIHTGMIAPEAREYSFSSNIDAPYYKVSAIDSLGRHYQSVTRYSQRADSIPPAPPTGISGSINKQGALRMTWQPNTEEDLMGYKAYYSLDSLDGFVEITPEVIIDTFCNHSINMEFDIPGVYVYVVAIDYNFNVSEHSELVFLDKPDITPPSNPLLTHVIPTPEGMRIGWKLSKEADVELHKLQRRQLHGSAWTDLAEIRDENEFPPLDSIAGESQVTRFIDTTKLARHYYQYRLWVSDQSGNVAVGEPVTVRPYDDGIRGEIQYQDGYEISLQSISAQVLSAAQILSYFIPNGHNNFSESRVAVLRWRYNTAYENTHRDFKIYFRYTDSSSSSQSGGGGSGGSGGSGGAGGSGGGGSTSGTNAAGDLSDFVLVATISRLDAEKAAGLIQYNGYAFAYAAAVKPDIPANMEFKIIATHSDGGFSQAATVLIAQ